MTVEHIGSELAMDLDELSFRDLVSFTEMLAAEIRKHANQGATTDEWRDAQAMCVVEEAGEFIGAYRRWRGFARRPGDFDQVTSELADVIIASFIMFVNLHEDAQVEIKKKLLKIITRGYVNKE